MSFDVPYPFEMLVADLAKVNVFVPLDGAEPVLLEAGQLDEVRSALRPEALVGFEKLVGLGAFGVHEPLDMAQILERKRVWDAAVAIKAKAEEEYQRLRAHELARARVLAEKALVHVAGDRLVKGGSVLDEPADVEAVWGSGSMVLWAKGQATMIVGHQGLGKTTLAQQVVLHQLGVRTGGFLDQPVALVQDGEAVLYLAMDRPVQAMGSLRRMVGEGAREALNEKLLVWRGPLPFSVVTEPDSLSAWIAEIGAGAGVKVASVIVDSVKDMAGGHSLSRDETGGALNLAWQRTLADGVDLLLLHHQRKASGGETRANTLDDVFGSTLLTSGLGSVFALAGDSGMPLVDLIHLKQPVEPVEMRLRHDHAVGVSVVAGEVSDEGLTVELLLQKAGGLGATVEELCVLLHGKFTATSKKSVSRDLASLKKSGVAVDVAGTMTGKGKAPSRWFYQGVSM